MCMGDGSKSISHFLGILNRQRRVNFVDFILLLPDEERLIICYLHKIYHVVQEPIYEILFCKPSKIKRNVLSL